jgi:copper chaperone
VLKTSGRCAQARTKVLVAGTGIAAGWYAKPAFEENTMTQATGVPRDAATDTRTTPTSPAPLAEDDVPEQDGSEDPGVGLQSIHDTAVVPEKEAPQSKGIATEGIPPSPSAMEHVDNRGGLRGATQGFQRDDGSPDASETETHGSGEGATVSHLPDGGPRSQPMMSFRVEDMHCDRCVNAITTSIRAVDANAGVEVSLEDHLVRVSSALAEDDVAAAIREAGYTPAGVPLAGE